MMYTGDYDGTLPSSAIVNRSKVWNKADFLRFATRQGTLPPPNHIAKGKATWAMLLYPYVKSHEASMTCPYDPDQYNERDAPASYYYKTALDKAWYGSGCTKRFRTDGDFDYPGDTVLFYERLPFHYQDLLDALHIRDSKLREGLLDGSRINVVYLDGHATMVRVRNATSGNPPDCATASDGEPMYFNYDNSTGKTVSGAAGYVDPGRYSDKLERLGD
jgi:prepilin-type processing-associated H-X9-DG protein